MNNKLVSFRRKYTVCSALNGNIQLIQARSRFDALQKGRRWFNHQCYLVNAR